MLSNTKHNEIMFEFVTIGQFNTQHNKAMLCNTEHNEITLKFATIGW